MSDRRHGLIFDEVPTLYDRYRPAYPAAAFDDIVALGGVPEAADVLEVGAGTGQATRSLLGRGMRVTALEAGPRMAAVLARNLADRPGSRVIRVRMEDAELPPGSFDLVLSATAFHWIDPELRFTLAARWLKPSGVLALLRNDHVAGPASAEYYRLAQAIYAREAPALGRALGVPDAAEVQGYGPEVAASGQFEIIAERRYRWDRRFDGATLIGLLRTYSDHRALPRARRARLFRELRRLLDERLGGSFVDHHLTTLCVAKRL